MIPRSLPDIHFGEVGELPEPTDVELDIESNEEEELLLADLIELLGFDPTDEPTD